MRSKLFRKNTQMDFKTKNQAVPLLKKLLSKYWEIVADCKSNYCLTYWIQWLKNIHFISWVYRKWSERPEQNSLLSINWVLMNCINWRDLSLNTLYLWVRTLGSDWIFRSATLSRRIRLQRTRGRDYFRNGRKKPLEIKNRF